MDYRPLPDDRKKQFQDYLHYAFSPEDGHQDEHDWDVDEQPGEPRVLFEGDRMLCACRHDWFQTRLRGHRFEMPGLSAVASPPEHRRKGYVTRLLVESLEEYRDRGDFLTALWAFEHPFYARQGWGLATKYTQFECDPDALAFARDSAAGEFRKIDADEFDALVPVLTADGEAYELQIERSEKWWRKRVLNRWPKDPFSYVWEKDGEIRGYVVYRVEDGDDGKRLVADELAAADHEARLNLLRFLANHDSQVERVRLYGPDDTRFLDLADDPAKIECEVKAGPMVRIVDVPRAIEALDYPETDDAEFTLSVADPLVEWNDRTFRVTVSGGRATCEPTSADADAQAAISALSQVYVGYHSVEDAETFADFDVSNPEARETLSAMFPPREVFLRERF